MMTEYDILYYNGWQSPPVYYWLGTIKGHTPEQALLKNSAKIAKLLEEEFGFEIGWMSEEKLLREIYVVRPNGLCSVPEARRIVAQQPKQSGRTKKR